MKNDAFFGADRSRGLDEKNVERFAQKNTHIVPAFDSEKLNDNNRLCADRSIFSFWNVSGFPLERNGGVVPDPYTRRVERSMERQSRFPSKLEAA